MKRQVSIGLVTLVVLVVLGMSLSLAQGLLDQADRGAISAGTTSAVEAPWFIDQVDSPDVGEHVSVAIHPETGVTYVSYYEADSQDLRLATHVGSGGNCGPNDTWSCETVDSEGDVGQYNSVAVYPGTSALNSWRLGIAYHDYTNAALKFAEYEYVTFPTPGYVWTISTVDTGAIQDRRGLYASLKYRGYYGYPYIAYFLDNSMGADSLRIAYKSSDGNCGPSNTWQCDTVDTGEGVGQYASLVLVENSGTKMIAYYGATSGHPMVARMYTGYPWGYFLPASQPPLDTGRHVSLALDDDDIPHIAYHNVTSGTLEYAKYVESGGNCGEWLDGSDYAWQCDEIDDVGTYESSSRRVSLALDGAGYPIIVYQDASGGALSAILKVARPIGALGTPIPYSGNCGPVISPPPNPRRSWQCDIIDGGGSNTDEAGSVSLAINSAGLATIAYHEYRFALPESSNDLKVAYQRLQVFLPLVLKNSP